MQMSPSLSDAELSNLLLVRDKSIHPSSSDVPHMRFHQIKVKDIVQVIHTHTHTHTHIDT